MVYKAAKKWGDNQTKEEEVTCSLVTEPYIFLEITARQKIIFLMEEYTNREWLAYLVGVMSKEGDFHVKDISVPPHKESFYTSAEAEPLHIPDKCIGVVHSHHTMGAFHSSTDQAYVDKNFPVSVTVSRNSEGALSWDAVSIRATPCGKTVSHKGIIKYIQPKATFDTGAWLKEAKEEIDKGQVHTYVYGRDALESKTDVNQKELPETTVPGVLKESPLGEKKQRVFSRKHINKIRHKIFETRGVMLTKGEVEAILDNNPLAFQGMEE